MSDDELAARLRLASALIAEREFEAAAAHLEVISRAEPNWFTYRYELARSLVYGAGDLERALDELDRCIEINPRIGACHQLRGLVLRDLGRAVEAVDALEEAMRLNPDHPGAYEPLARLYVALGRDSDAAPLVDAELRRRGEDVSLLLLRAGICEREGDPAAESYLIRVASAHHEPITGLNYLLRYYERSGRADEADRIRQRIESELRRRRPRRQMRSI